MADCGDLRRADQSIVRHSEVVSIHALPIIQIFKESIMGKIIKKALFGGGATRAIAKSVTVQRAEKRQADDLVKLEKKEKKQEAALSRKRRGKASLISGYETGIKDTLG